MKDIKRFVDLSAKGWTFQLEAQELRKPVYNSHLGPVVQITSFFLVVGISLNKILSGIGFTHDEAWSSLFERIDREDQESSQEVPQETVQGIGS